MIYYTKEAVELLHLISEQEKGIPIITVFDIEAQNYKYGKKAYCNIIEKQITDAFEFTAMYADRELNISFDDYVGLYILDPDSEAELKTLNELLEYLQSDPIEKEKAPEPPIKYTAKHYALAYLFDCDANGRPRLESHKKDLERIGGKRSKHKIDGNTFYKAFNEIHSTDINIERNLINIAGANWKQVISNLSENPTLLNEYLKKKQL